MRPQRPLIQSKELGACVTVGADGVGILGAATVTTTDRTTTGTVTIIRIIGTATVTIIRTIATATVIIVRTIDTVTVIVTNDIAGQRGPASASRALQRAARCWELFEE